MPIGGGWPLSCTVPQFFFSVGKVQNLKKKKQRESPSGGEGCGRGVAGGVAGV